MAQQKITREEFDRRLELATERMRQNNLALEAQAAELEDLIGRYASLLERLEAEATPEADTTPRNDLRRLLTELAERTSAVAASL